MIEFLQKAMNEVRRIKVAPVNASSITISLGSIPNDSDVEVKKIISNDVTRIKEILKMIFVIMFPIVILFIVTGVSLNYALNRKYQQDLAKLSIDRSLLISKLVGNMQKERGLSAMHLASQNTTVAMNSLIVIRSTVDGNFKQVRQVAQDLIIHPSGLNISKPLTVDGLRQLINLHRDRVNEKEVSINDNIIFYTVINEKLMRIISEDILLPEGNTIWNHFVSMTNFLHAADSLGIQRALGSTYYSSCVISNKNALWILELDAESSTYINIATIYDKDVRVMYYNKIQDITDTITNLTLMKEQILNVRQDTECLQKSSEARMIPATLWWDDTTTYINVILSILREDITQLSYLISLALQRTESDLAIYSTVMVLVVVGSAMLSTYYIISINRMTGKISNYAKSMSSKTRELSQEKKKTERLLLQMLPKSVAGDATFFLMKNI